jgi:hypothetical protein
MCTKPLHCGGARFYNNGCNSWKGKNFDGPMTKVLTGKVAKHPNKHASHAQIVGGLALAYLAMVASYGYIVALTRSGLILREQFFNPNKLHKALGPRSRIIYAGEPQTDPNDPIWANPFRFELEEQVCLVTVRNFVIFLPISRDPTIPIVRHLKMVPQRLAFRPNFDTWLT